MNLAHIRLLDSRFQIEGPGELVGLTQSVVASYPEGDERIKYGVEDLWESWYVVCSVSGEHVSLKNLKYWDVAKQTIYARPELVPVPDCYD